ncbi:MAG: hypothetical protein CMO30_24580 [Tistrella sp.]|uniref:Uncharacterized protein n=1 Tax=Tistrella mobilis TaxID=171437 RepID=A0A3B9ID66_9PROT|nr:hypothetical protein [Tistrella sp.]MAD35471.1 hypothetical protein [Tistrella sp.]MBA78456.1 hypothetical protein [Tistrella sp.]HAE45831.1 hypothetical protein [Tistrella mobilis]
MTGELETAIRGIDVAAPGAEADAYAIWRRAIAAAGEARAQQLVADEAGWQWSALRRWFHRRHHRAVASRAAAERAAAEHALDVVRARYLEILRAVRETGE